MHEDTLARVDLFRGLDKKDLRILAASCQERKYRPLSKGPRRESLGLN